MLFDEDDECRRNEEFVGYRIKKFPKRRNLIAASGELPVNDVRNCGDHKEYDRQSIAAHAEPRFGHRRQKYHDQQRDDDYPAEGYVVWKVHPFSLRPKVQSPKLETLDFRLWTLSTVRAAA